MKKLMLLAFMFVFTLSLASQRDSSGKLTPTANEPVLPPLQSEDTSSVLEKIYNPLSDVELILSVLAIIFGIAFLWLVRDVASQKLSGSQYLQLLTLILVVCAAMFLISAGFNSNQSAPAFSVLGTIVGYLLGKHSGETKSTNDAAPSEAE